MSEMKISPLANLGLNINSKSTVVLMDPTPKELQKINSQLVITSIPASIDPLSFSREKNGYLIASPGEYEVKGVGVRALSESAEETVFLINIEKMMLCHLGHLSHRLSAPVQEELGNVDILFLPLDGNGGLDAKLAVEVMNQVEPLVVIPLFNEDKALEAFAKEMGGGEIRQESNLTISSNTLPQEMEVVVLSN